MLDIIFTCIQATIIKENINNRNMIAIDLWKTICFKFVCIPCVQLQTSEGCTVTWAVRETQQCWGWYQLAGYSLDWTGCAMDDFSINICWSNLYPKVSSGKGIEPFEWNHTKTSAFPLGWTPFSYVESPNFMKLYIQASFVTWTKWISFCFGKLLNSVLLYIHAFFPQ